MHTLITRLSRNFFQRRGEKDEKQLQLIIERVKEWGHTVHVRSDIHTYVQTHTHMDTYTYV